MVRLQHQQVQVTGDVNAARVVRSKNSIIGLGEATQSLTLITGSGLRILQVQKQSSLNTIGVCNSKSLQTASSCHYR